MDRPGRCLDLGIPRHLEDLVRCNVKIGDRTVA
jgi:hypothetical protein